MAIPGEKAIQMVRNAHTQAAQLDIAVTAVVVDQSGRMIALAIYPVNPLAAGQGRPRESPAPREAAQGFSACGAMFKSLRAQLPTKGR